MVPYQLFFYARSVRIAPFYSHSYEPLVENILPPEAKKSDRFYTYFIP